MADAPIWEGTALAVAEVDTFTPANVNIGNVFNLTDAGGNIISFTATAATVANVVAGLLAKLAEPNIPARFRMADWTDGTTALVATSNTPGRPFNITSNATGGTATFVRTATTPNSGPNNWDVAANWSTGTIPANADAVTLDGNVSILYGLSQSGVTLASLNAPASFTGSVGLPRWNPLGFYETLPRYLNIKSTVVNVGQGDGQGSPRFLLDTDSAVTTLSLFKTASAAEPGIPAMLWKGTNAGNLVRITRGSFGAAFHPGEVATISDLKVGWLTNKLSDANVVTGSGVTLGTIGKSGGVLTTYGPFTSINQLDGTARIAGSFAGTIALILCDGGIAYLDADSCTVTDLTGSGEFNLDGSLLGIILTNVNLFENFKYTDSRLRATYTNGIKFNHCGDLSKLDLGENFKMNGFTIL